MKIPATAAAGFALALAMPALAQTTPSAGTTEKMSTSDCTAAWGRLNTASAANKVSQAQAQGVVTDFKAADTNNDGQLSQAEFTAACDKGLVTASGAAGSGGRGMTGTDVPKSSPGTSTTPGGTTK